MQRSHRRRALSTVLVLVVTAASLGSPASATATRTGAGSTTPAREVPVWMTASTGHPTAAPATTSAPSTGEEAAGPVVAASVAGTERRLGNSTRTYVEVMVAGSPDTAAFERAGVRIDGTVGNMLLVSVESRGAGAVAALPGVVSLRTPADLRAGVDFTGTVRPPTAPARRTEAGTDSVTAQVTLNFHSHGFTGSGVKVGVIDFFDPALFSAQVASGDIPVIPSGHRQCWYLGTTCPFGTPGATHGNNVLEVMYDGAPGGEYYLAEVGTITDYLKAIDWFATNGVSVINHSLLGPFDGPGDGTGSSAYVVDYAVSKGITWFNAAGNAGADPQYTSYQGGYWRGTWSDPDADRWLNFKGTDESLGTYCGALMGLRWSDWGAKRADYDLYVTDFKASSGTNATTKYTASSNNQLAGAAPLEGNDLRWLCNHTPADGPVYDLNGDNFVSLWVQRKSTSPAANSTGDTLELMVNSGWFEYSSSPGSAGIPFGDSKNPGMASIGAVRNIITAEGFSAQGPTNDGRVKPDLGGIGCDQTSLAGSCDNDGFAGTSVSSPYVAALAVVMRQQLGPMTPATLVTALRNTALSTSGYLGNPVTTVAQLPTNTVGWGIPNLVGSFPIDAYYGTTFTSLNPVRVLDTRIAGDLWRGPKVMPPGGALNLPLGHMLDINTIAVAMNITIVGATQPGYVQLYPTKMGFPGSSSNVNGRVAGQTVANFAIVPLGLNGEVTLYNTSGGHVIVDLLGSFSRANNGGRWNTMVPQRLYDSRCGGCVPMQAGQPLDIEVLGLGNQLTPFEHVPPTGVSAVMVNVTIDQPSGKGYVSAVPDGTAWPVTTSTANYLGASVSGVAIVPIVPGSDEIRLYSSLGAHVQVDLLGYFAETAPGGFFFPLTPARFVDTRQTSGAQRPNAGAATDVTIAGRLGVPSQAGSVFYNLTVTKSAGTGEAQITPGTAAPATVYRSLAIGVPDGAIANSGITALDGGHATIFASTATHRILDIAGWFSGGDKPLPAGTISPMRTTAGATPDGYTWAIDVSHDGRYVAIFGTSTNLVPGTNGTIADIVVWDRVTNTYERANLGDNEEIPNILGLSSMSISADGTQVAFMSMATNLVPNDTNNRVDLFIRDLVADTTVRVPIEPTDSINVVDPNFALMISDDMETIVYSTKVAALPVDTDAHGDVYVFHRSANTLELAISPTQPVFTGWTPFMMSADGSTVADGTQVWRDGIGATPAPFEARQLNALSANGATAITSTTTGGTDAWSTTFFTVDIASGVATQLCTSTTNYVGMTFAGNGPRTVAGGGCGADKGGVWVHSGASTVNVFRSWNGMLPDGSVWSWAISGDGSTVIYVSNSYNLLPGFTPTTAGSWVYVHEVPEP